MSENQTIHQLIMERFPVRRSKKEKAAFREWAAGFCEEHGWKVTIEEPSNGYQKNIVIGNPDGAAILFAAHYDTPNNSLLPNLRMPCNPVLSVLREVLILLIMFTLALLCDDAAGLLGAAPQVRAVAFAAAFLLLAVLMNIFPNRNNANGGTSGLAAALQMIAALPEEDREKCAFLLFDDGEKALKGSKRYTRDHAELAYMRMTVALDAVGDGDTFLFASRDMARRCTGFGQFQRVLTEKLGSGAVFRDSKACRIHSDNSSFKCGIGVGAYRRKPVAGWFTGRLHSRWDTVCSQENLDTLSDALVCCVTSLKTL